MKKDELAYVVTGIGLGIAGIVAYLATRSAGPVQMTQYTEQREGPLMEHLVSREELGLIPAAERMHYPTQVAPGITQCIIKGFAPLYQPPDVQAASLPAEQVW
jgi:hypothetical protein